MLASQLTLKNASGDAIQFNEILSNDPSTKLRVRAGSTQADLCTLQISHTTTGSGSAAIHRILIKGEMSKVSTAGKTVRLPVNLTVAYPQEGTFTDIDAKNLMGYIVTLITGGSFDPALGFQSTSNVDDILRGGA